MSAEVTTKSRRTLRRKDLFWSYLFWLLWSHSLNNYERLMGTGFCTSMVPIINRLYDTKKEISAALKRHMVFFNVQPVLGALIHGMVAAMEEERANGADISDDAINGLKIGLSGPLAGLGDTLYQALVVPIFLGICIGWAMEGQLWAPFLYIAVMFVVIFGSMWFFYMSGYRFGSGAVDRILEGGLMGKVTAGASVAGLMVAAVMMVRFVRISIPITFGAGATSTSVQDVLNKIIPGLLPLITTVGVWRLLLRKVKALYIVLGLFVIGFVGGWFGLLAKG